MDPQDGLTRGQVRWLWLDPIVGSEQAGRRPAVIVSTSDMATGPTVIVVPLTSSMPSAMGPYMAFLPRQRTGLPRDSVALCHHVRSVSVRRLGRPTGVTLGPDDMAAVDAALRYTLGLEDAD